MTASEKDALRALAREVVRDVQARAVAPLPPLFNSVMAALYEAYRLGSERQATVQQVAQEMRQERESNFNKPWNRHGHQLERWADLLAPPPASQTKE